MDPTPDTRHPTPQQKSKWEALWVQWEQLKEMLMRVGSKANLGHCEVELMVDGVLEKLLDWVEKGELPKNLGGWCLVLLKHELGKDRCVFKRIEDQFSDYRKIERKEWDREKQQFWKAIEEKPVALKRLLTEAEIACLFAIKKCSTIREAGRELGELPINVRNRMQRISKKLGKFCRDRYPFDLY